MKTRPGEGAGGTSPVTMTIVDDRRVDGRLRDRLVGTAPTDPA